MNQNSANSCLKDIIHISIESFKLLLNEIKKIENKNYFIKIISIIHKDAFLSKGASNEETMSQDRQQHPCKMVTENSLLVNN